VRRRGFGSDQFSQCPQLIVDITIETLGDGDVKKTAERDEKHPEDQDVPERQLETETSEMHLRSL
jgi:hypothetical protein